MRRRVAVALLLTVRDGVDRVLAELGHKPPAPAAVDEDEDHPGLGRELSTAFEIETEIRALRKAKRAVLHGVFH